jgi:hypothetical protein
MLGWVKFFIYITFFVVLSIRLSNSGEREFNLGELATKEEVAGWDIDVRPDGFGAPVGAGNALSGEEIYAERCGFCHGDFGEGIDRWPELIGGEDSLNSHDPIKTTSSYWPFASTMYDYIYRAMPFGEAQSLTVDETYSIVAYLLYMGDIIDEEFNLSNENIGEINMPNKDGFLLPDPRPDVASFEQSICMNDCDAALKVIGRARDLDVTPEDEN